MSVADLDIVSIGVSSGSGLIQDRKSTITTWTKDGTASGHFNAANANVTVGCVVTFADASSATIVAKTGDGTAANNITLSADHATDSGLASITGLVYAAPNVQPNSIWANETVVGDAGSAAYTLTGGYTNFATSWSLANGRRITKVGLYSSATSGTVTFKIIRDDGGGTYTVTNLQQFNKSASGYEEYTLSTPYVIPSSGTFYLGIYTPSNYGNMNENTGHQYSKSGDLTGSQGSWLDGGGYHCHITARYDQCFTAPDLYAVATESAEVNTNPWFALSGVTVTQTLGSGAVAYHAACFNKGAADSTWWVYLSSAWRSIVVLSSGTWQYRDAGGTLQNATINSRLGALSQAFAIAQNQMNKAALEAITAPQWASVFVSGTLDFACGMQASGNNLPQLDKWTATFTAKPIYALSGPGFVAGLSAFGG